jgi:hypothetical protein
MMVKIKEMPNSEKYANTLGYTKLLDTFIPPLVQKHLGNEGVAEVQRIWREGLKPIPEDASFKEKYEIAYANWMWKWSSAFDFVQTHFGESGVEEFKRADLEALKRKNSGPALFLLNVIRALSPSSAFSMIAKQMASQFQVFTPLSVSEMTGQRAVFKIPRCKILDFKGGESSCLIGCRSIFPMWLAEQLKVRMKTERQGNSCTVTLTPLG